MSPVLIQALVLALFAAWSLVFAFRKLLPSSARRLQARLARSFDREPFPAWLRTFAHRLEPHSTTGSSCASGNSCSSCGGCAAALSAPAPVVQPLHFRPKAR